MNIIQQIYDLKIVDKLAKRYASYIGQDNIDDFKQTIYCMLLEIPEKKLQSLYEKNQLVFYTIAIARNQAVNYRSTFNQHYNNDKLVFVDDITLVGRTSETNLIQSMSETNLSSENIIDYAR